MISRFTNLKIIKMSVNLNRQKTKLVTDRKIHKIMTIYDLDPYDESDCYKRKSGLYPVQTRMYRTWKHNRRTQWKNK